MGGVPRNERINHRERVLSSSPLSAIEPVWSTALVDGLDRERVRHGTSKMLAAMAFWCTPEVMKRI